ncbi:S-adenosyl-L-methionine-dependent methyltransferase [Mycena kentingensis (nom. inval.)]|nr:S-adenosyl-L-methionine-dependent methyltransferase [Mycena kentingensis (nom. inval.)]
MKLVSDTALHHAWSVSGLSTSSISELWSVAAAALAAVAYSLYTLWLFTESDFMTTMVPISIFGIVAAPLTNPAHVPHLLLHLWLSLLAFNTSNQSSPRAVAEDCTNKPTRPIPAARISLEHVRVLRWALPPAVWCLSAAYSKETLGASVALSFFTWWYNELGGSGRMCERYLLNGLGFAAFEAGTTLIAGNDRSGLDRAGWLAIFLSGSIFATTIYAQDFRDVVGDAEICRTTIPLRFGYSARPALLLGILAWSVLLSLVWELDLYTTAGLIALGAWAGGRFVLWTSVEEDRRSYFWYNIWVCAAHLAPGYWRYLRV